jgi:hypothetical protein
VSHEVLLRIGLEPIPQNLQFCALPVELPKLYGEIGTRTLTSVMQTQNTSLYIISPFSFSIFTLGVGIIECDDMIRLSTRILRLNPTSILLRKGIAKLRQRSASTG